MNLFSFLIKYVLYRIDFVKKFAKILGIDLATFNNLLAKNPQKLADTIKKTTKLRQSAFVSEVVKLRDATIKALKENISEIKQSAIDLITKNKLIKDLEFELERLQPKKTKEQETEASIRNSKEPQGAFIVENDVPNVDVSVLSSSWLIFGSWEIVGQNKGNLTLTLISGNSYTWPLVPWSVWVKMKAAKGRNGTGAGSVFWKYYLRGYRAEPTKFIFDELYIKQGLKFFNWQAIKRMNVSLSLQNYKFQDQLK